MKNTVKYLLGAFLIGSVITARAALCDPIIPGTPVTISFDNTVTATDIYVENGFKFEADANASLIKGSALNYLQIYDRSTPGQGSITLMPEVSTTVFDFMGFDIITGSSGSFSASLYVQSPKDEKMLFFPAGWFGTVTMSALFPNNPSRVDLWKGIEYITFWPGEGSTFFVNIDNVDLLAYASSSSTGDPKTPVPLPGTLFLMGTGLVALGSYFRKTTEKTV